MLKKETSKNSRGLQKFPSVYPLKTSYERKTRRKEKRVKKVNSRGITPPYHNFTPGNTEQKIPQTGCIVIKSIWEPFKRERPYNKNSNNNEDINCTHKQHKTLSAAPNRPFTVLITKLTSGCSLLRVN